MMIRLFWKKQNTEGKRCAVRRPAFMRALMVTLLILLWMPVTASATTDRVIFDDAAGLFSESEKSTLYTNAEGLSERTGWDVFVVTTDDADGKEAVEYAEDYYMDHFRQDNGFTALLDMDNREIYLATSGEVIYYITDDRREEILDNAFEAVSEGDYAGCMKAMLDGVSRAYSAGIDGNHYTYNEETGEIEYYIPPKTLTPLKIIIGVVLGVLGGLGMNVLTRLLYEKNGKGYHYNLSANSKLTLRGKNDTLVNRYTTSHRIERDSDGGSSGSGSRSTVHTGSGGHTFGGGGRKF